MTDLLLRIDGKFTLKKVTTHNMQTSQCNYLLVPAVWPALFSCGGFWVKRPNSFEQMAKKIKIEV